VPGVCAQSAARGEDDDEDYGDQDGDGNELDPTLIWNASARHRQLRQLSPTSNNPPPLTVSYPSREPLKFNGKRASRAPIVSTQFVP
jgi:hypothetical protein